MLVAVIAVAASMHGASTGVVQLIVYGLAPIISVIGAHDRSLLWLSVIWVELIPPPPGAAAQLPPARPVARLRWRLPVALTANEIGMSAVFAFELITMPCWVGDVP